MGKAIVRKRKYDQCCAIKNIFQNTWSGVMSPSCKNYQRNNLVRIDGIEQQQKFCWADVFKPQIKDKASEECIVMKHNGNAPMEMWK